MSSGMTQAQALSFWSDFGNALGKYDQFDVAGGGAALVDGMAELIGELTASVRSSVMAEAQSYAVQAEALGKYATAWETVTARIAAEGNPAQAAMVEWGQGQAAVLRSEQAAMQVATTGAAASQAFGRAVGVMAGTMGVAVSAAQIVDAAWTGGAEGAGEKTLGALAGLAAAGAFLAYFGIGLAPILVAAAVGYGFSKLGEVVYRNEWLSPINDFFKYLGVLGKESGSLLFDLVHGKFDPNSNTAYLASRSWRAATGDPLVLDLDGDGIETTALSTTSPILFDLNADGVKTGTGWLKPDDGFLALDRNGNGLIDNGTELFGDATPLTAGGTAHDGLAALADLDTNHDGRIDANDAAFAQLRVWRDLNQDGISQANELTSLAGLGIAAIDLTRTANTTNLANGNQIADQAAFLKTDNTTGGIGSMADVNLAGNPFYSHFTERLDTSAVAGLPDMQGAGMVRDLKEAASLSGGLAGTLSAYANAATREQQMALLDGLLAAWADTSTMDTSIEQAATNGMKLIYLAPGETIQDAVQIDNMAGEPGELSPAEFARRRELQARQEHLTGLIGLLEKFNGQTFVTVNPHSVTTGTGAEVIGVTQVGTYESGFPLAAVALSQAQADLLEQGFSGDTPANDDTWSQAA